MKYFPLKKKQKSPVHISMVTVHKMGKARSGAPRNGEAIRCRQLGQGLAAPHEAERAEHVTQQPPAECTPQELEAHRKTCEDSPVHTGEGQRPSVLQGPEVACTHGGRDSPVGKHACHLLRHDTPWAGDIKHSQRPAAVWFYTEAAHTGQTHSQTQPGVVASRGQEGEWSGVQTVGSPAWNGSEDGDLKST